MQEALKWGLSRDPETSVPRTWSYLWSKHALCWIHVKTTTKKVKCWLEERAERSSTRERRPQLYGKNMLSKFGGFPFSVSSVSLSPKFNDLNACVSSKDNRIYVFVEMGKFTFAIRLFLI